MNVYLVYPMAAMVLLTFFVLMKMFFARVRSVRAGETDAGFYKTYQEGKESRDVAQYSRHLVNMFESPNLFYAACIVGMLIGQNAVLLVALAWLYVAMRAVHAYIHTGRNRLPPRIKIYFSSWLVLLGMWGTLVIGVATK